MALMYKYSVYADKGEEASDNRQNFFANGQYMNFKEMNAGAAYVAKNPSSRQIFALMKEEKAEGRASNMASLFLDRLRKKKNKLRVAQTSEYLRHTLMNMDRGIRENLQGEHGTMLSMLYINNNNAHAACVGSDAIYKYFQMDNRLEKLENNLSANNRLGKKPEIFGEIVPFVTSLGKVSTRKNYLLINDVLDHALTPEEIVEVLASASGNVAEALVDAAREKGTGGNACAIYIQPQKKKWWIIPLIVVLVLAGIFTIKSTGLIEKIQNIGQPESAQTQTDTTEPTTKKQETKSVAEETEKAVPGTMRALKKDMDTFAGYVTGDESKVTYYVKDLTTGEEIFRNAELEMDAVGSSNLYIMAEIYRLQAEGTITIGDTVKKQLELMLGKNDKDSRKALLSLIGNGDVITGAQNVTENTTKKLGLTATVVTAEENEKDETSAKDCGALLEMIYNKELVSEAASEEMMKWLKLSANDAKIPLFLPDGTVVANHPGQASAVQNDAGIVYTVKGNFIVSVMISNYTNSSEEAEEIIASMTEAVYKFITSES